MARPLALVTGASSGIGLVFARPLAARDHDLVVTARSPDKLRELAASLPGTDVEVLAADLAAPSGVKALEERLRWGDRPVDVLVNNAGFGTTGRFVELPPDQEEQEIRLNVLALTMLTSAALPGM